LERVQREPYMELNIDSSNQISANYCGFEVYKSKTSQWIEYQNKIYTLNYQDDLLTLELYNYDKREKSNYFIDNISEDSLVFQLHTLPIEKFKFAVSSSGDSLFILYHLNNFEKLYVFAPSILKKPKLIFKTNTRISNLVSLTNNLVLVGDFGNLYLFNLTNGVLDTLFCNEINSVVRLKNDMAFINTESDCFLFRVGAKSLISLNRNLKCLSNNNFEVENTFYTFERIYGDKFIDSVLFWGIKTDSNFNMSQILTINSQYLNARIFDLIYYSVDQENMLNLYFAIYEEQSYRLKESESYFYLQYDIKEKKVVNEIPRLNSIPIFRYK